MEKTNMVDSMKVFTENKDLTISNIRDMVDENDLILNPDYQRDYIYDESKASKLVESIVMDIPIPIVYFSEEDEGVYSVIDGQQRITSLVKFIKNEFKLKNLEVLSNLNGLNFKDLDKATQRKFKTSTLKAICLKKESQHLKYEIFARLNQGSVSLKPQELRNCIYRGSFNDMLEAVANEKILKELFREDNKRKTYQENALRFFALRDFNSFNSSLLKTMNKYMEKNQNLDKNSIETLKQTFLGTMDIIKQVLGEKAFCSYDRDKKCITNKFSGSVYDSIAIPFSMFNKHDLMKNADRIRQAIKDIKINNLEYMESTYAGTGTKKRVVQRIMIIYNLIAEIVGSYGGYEENRLFANDIKQKLFYDGYVCNYCNNEILSMADAEVDHIIPFSLGGTTDIENAQLLHKHCNRSKSNSIIEEKEDTEYEATCLG